MPTSFLKWYYNNASVTLGKLNPFLNQSVVNDTCKSSFECIHDYLIQINPVSSKITAIGLENLALSKTLLSKVLISEKSFC